jgi:WD40 repeat protein
MSLQHAGQHLASCSADKTVRIWAAASPTSHYQQSADQLEHIENIDQAMPQTWRCVAVLEDAHSRTIRSISWSPDGKQLAMASFDATTTIWARTGTAWEQVTFQYYYYASCLLYSLQITTGMPLP